MLCFCRGCVACDGVCLCVCSQKVVDLLRVIKDSRAKHPDQPVRLIFIHSHTSVSLLLQAEHQMHNVFAPLARQMSMRRAEQRSDAGDGKSPSSRSSLAAIAALDRQSPSPSPSPHSHSHSHSASTCSQNTPFVNTNSRAAICRPAWLSSRAPQPI